MTASRRTLWSLTAAAALVSAAPVLAQNSSNAPAPTPAPSSADSTPKRAVRQSWTSDRREFAVGDIITVLVDERMLASAILRDNAEDSRKRSADFSLQSGATSPPTSVSFGDGSTGQSRKSGEATRDNEFRAEMSTRVVSVSPTGLLQVKGRKLANLDKNEQELTLTGWLRPQDVTRDNTVDSWRIADAELVYKGKGPLGKPKGGLFWKIIGAFWP
jgi:flagellar L-ring protein FlgH